MIWMLSFRGRGGWLVDADGFPDAIQKAYAKGAPRDVEVIGGCIDPLDPGWKDDPSFDPNDVRHTRAIDPANHDRLLSAEETERLFGEPMDPDQIDQDIEEGRIRNIVSPELS
jgi:hypothetical protein